MISSDYRLNDDQAVGFFRKLFDMKPSPSQRLPQSQRHFYSWKFVCLLLALSLQGFAKDAPLSAIVLFDSPAGPAYVQITGATLNGKTELRTCDGVPKFDKRTYDVMPRVQLRISSVLQRTSDGVLMLSMDATKPFCVVPNGIKFDKSPELTPAQAIDQAAIVGLVAQSSTQQAELPALKPGVELFFVAAPDTEFAEFLRAQRAQSVALWQDYLKRYPASAHAAQARQGLAAMLAQSAESALAEYAKNTNPAAPRLALLKQARIYAGEAETLSGNHAPAATVLQALHAQLDLLLEKDRRQLQAFTKAVSDHAAGYEHLAAAGKQNERILEVDPDYPPANALRNEIRSEENKLDAILHNADSLLLAKSYDDALQAVEAYRGMAAEIPQIANIVETDFRFHFSRGQQLSAQSSWEQAAVEFRAAIKVRPENQETAQALRNAEAQAANAFNRRVVEQALADSRNYVQKNDLIAAYDVLANLPDQQRMMVTDQMEALKKDYAPAAARRAQRLRKSICRYAAAPTKKPCARPMSCFAAAAPSATIRQSNSNWTCSLTSSALTILTRPAVICKSRWLQESAWDGSTCVKRSVMSPRWTP